ncbi:MAG: hypothetical protein LBJ64_00415 [Deltaproteobacteria bacterium]|jgi:hypothetical protein|nr:hypothetical protein [Deltaproteobacteria bacterium]
MSVIGILTKKQSQIIKEMEKLAKKKGIRVSGGKLNFGGLKLKGGRCVLRQVPWIIVDRTQGFEEQLDLFRLALADAKVVKEDLAGLSAAGRDLLNLVPFADVTDAPKADSSTTDPPTLGESAPDSVASEVAE